MREDNQNGKIDARRLAELLRINHLTATPEPVLMLAQKLEQEVISDWNSLPGDKIRKKRDSSKPYDATLARLLETDKLSPNVRVMVTQSVREPCATGCPRTFVARRNGARR